MQIKNIRNEKVGITTDPIDIKRLVKEYYEHLYATTLITGMKWTSFLKIQSAKTQGEIDNLHRSTFVV